jgi:zinc and cadmium transporter
VQELLLKLIIYSLGVTLVAFGGGILPLLGKWNHKQLHMFVAFGAGTILGAIFFHLLPDSLSLGSPDLASAMMLVGFIAILLVERILLKEHSHGAAENALTRHELVSMTALVGLSVHSLAGGFGLAVGMVDARVGLIIFIAIISHKATESFSLCTIFRLAEFAPRKTIGLLILFSFMTPIGALISLPFIHTLKNVDLSIPTGLTAGTFLYVATLDLIPEAFHDTGNRLLPFFWMLLGMGIMLVIKFAGV